MPAKTRRGPTTPDAPTVSQAFHDIEVAEFRSRLAELNEKYKHTLALFREADERLNAVMGLKKALDGHEPRRIKVKAEGRPGESVAVMVASDWHLEERIDPATVNGLNEYTPEIADRRIKAFAQNGLALVEMCRRRSRIDTLILPLLGDLITGMLHDDQKESNYLSPTEASLKVHSVLCGVLDFLLEEGKFKRIIVPCCFGNHGRTTQKMRVSTSAKNSYEWLVYQFLRLWYADEPRLEFQISAGYFVFLDVYQTRIRCHHGDDVRYQGGVGGLTIPLNKAIAQWNKAHKVDLDLLGHWHSRQSARDFVVNGSAIGYSPYSIFVKGSYEPPMQSFFLIHPEWGKTVEAPIFLD